MHHSRPMSFYVFLALTVIWFIFMTWLSHQNGEQTLDTSWGLAERLKYLLGLNVETETLNYILRKLAHVAVFAVLTVLLSMTVHAGRLSRWIAAFPFVWSYIDEATKPLIEGRHFAWDDVGLNEIGCLIGIIIFALYRYAAMSGRNG